MEPKILLDMDGVLADFHKGAAIYFGKPANGDWNFWHHWGMTDSDFWPQLTRGFWANLPKTPECNEFVSLAETLIGRENVCLLSSPCLTVGCMEGKLDWIKKHLPQYQRQFLFGPAKQFAASRYHCLVDDYDKNFDTFIDHGGCAVLVPRLWNSDHHRPMSDVRDNLLYWYANLTGKVND